MYDHEKLDAILLFLSQQKPGPNFISVHAERINTEVFHHNMDIPDLVHYLDKLEADGFIKTTRTKDGVAAYIMAEGAFFVKSGGYSKDSLKQVEKEQREKSLYEAQLKDLNNRISSFEKQVEFWERSAQVNKKKARLITPSFWISVLSLIVSALALLRTFDII